MSNPIVNGLPLGLRFYDSEDQQCKYKYTCQKGVTHQEYQYADACSVPPFQVLRSPIPAATFQMYLVCSSTGVEYDMNTLCAAMVAAITLKTVGLYDYITYPGGEYHTCCAFPFTTKILVYVKLEDGTNQWFSEEFWIDPEGVDSGDTNYRLWIAGQRRASPDLRIWR